MAKKKKIYTMLWRNKYLCTEATSFDEFIGCLENAVRCLKDMKEAGVKIDLGGVEDDYVDFYTHDAELAEKFGLQPE